MVVGHTMSKVFPYCAAIFVDSLASKSQESSSLAYDDLMPSKEVLELG